MRANVRFLSGPEAGTESMLDVHDGSLIRFPLAPDFSFPPVASDEEGDTVGFLTFDYRVIILRFASGHRHVFAVPDHDTGGPVAFNDMWHEYSQAMQTEEQQKKTREIYAQHARFTAGR